MALSVAFAVETFLFSFLAFCDGLVDLLETVLRALGEIAAMAATF